MTASALRRRARLVGALGLGLAVVATWFVILLVDPGRAASALWWAWPAGAAALGVLAGVRLRRLERMRRPYL